MESNMQRFWCHNCKMDFFQTATYLKCFFCSSELIEEVDASSPHPSTFIPERPNRNIPMTLPIRIFTRVLFLIDDGEEISEGLADEDIERLENVKNCKDICSVCQEVVGDGKKMKCNHKFHKECIGPWLKVKNSCPVCRSSAI